MWLHLSTAGGWSPGLILGLSLACAICPCHCMKHVLDDVGDDAWMLEDLLLSHRLVMGLMNQNAAQCSEGCTVWAPLEPWTDTTYTVCYVRGLCLFLPFLYAQLGFMNCREGLKTQAEQWSALLCLSFCVIGMEILGAPRGTCISLLSLVTQKPWKSLLLFLSQTLFQHL